MFVIQRVLESSGRLTLLDQSRVIRPHPAFRLFATANTVGLGDTPASITAPSRSTRRRWTAGRSSPR
jgi:MoxR-like ATPase